MKSRSNALLTITVLGDITNCLEARCVITNLSLNNFSIIPGNE